MKKYICSFLLIFLFATIQAKDWTILFYMAADNGLSDYAITEIEELEQSDFVQNNNVIVQLDGASWSEYPDTYRFKIGYHPEAGIQSRVIKNLGEIDTGDWHNLNSFLQWGYSKYPAKNKALVIWSHGDGWTKQEALNKYIAIDETSDSLISMALHELQNALTNISLDFLIYDACNMQTTENITEMFKNADYIIGSQEEVRVSGYPYKEIFNFWKNESDIEKIAQEIPKIMVDSYRLHGSNNPNNSNIKTTCSTVKTENWKSYQDNLVNFFLKWSNRTDLFVKSREKVHEFSARSADIDVNELLGYLIKFEDNPTLVNEAQELQKQLKKIFISYDATAYDNSDLGTATLWFPRYRYPFSFQWQFYHYLDFAQTGYGYFLNQYLNPDDTPPLKFKVKKCQLINSTLFLDWQIRLDPDTLNYKIDFYFNDGTKEQIKEDNSGKLQKFVTSAGQVMITATDKVGNKTTTDWYYFGEPKKEDNLFFAPNPWRNKSACELVIYDQNNSRRQARISLYSASGKLVAKKNITIPEMTPDYRIKVNSFIKKPLASGIYFCIVDVQGKIMKAKLSITN